MPEACILLELTQTLNRYLCVDGYRYMRDPLILYEIIIQAM